MSAQYLTADGEITPIATPFFKTPNNHDTLAEGRKTALYCEDASKTQQHLAAETDINNIVDKFLRTGEIKQIPLPPTFQDWGEDEFDFQAALNRVNQAKASFMMLPAEVRDAFHNDPGRFVSTVDDMLNEPDQARREQNLQTLRALNLAVAPGPVPDKTSLGDILAALKAQPTLTPPPAANGGKGAS